MLYMIYYAIINVQIIIAFRRRFPLKSATVRLLQQ